MILAAGTAAPVRPGIFQQRVAGLYVLRYTVSMASAGNVLTIASARCIVGILAKKGGGRMNPRLLWHLATITRGMFGIFAFDGIAMPFGRSCARLS